MSVRKTFCYKVIIWTKVAACREWICY